MSKAEHFLRENEFAAIGFAMIDAVVHLERIWRIGSCGCPPRHGDQTVVTLTPASTSPARIPGSAARSDLADPGEGHEPDLGAVGDDDHRAGALDQCPVRVGLNLVMRRQAGFEGDPIRAHEHDVEVKPCQACLGNGSDQLVGLGPGHSARHHEL